MCSGNLYDKSFGKYVVGFLVKWAGAIKLYDKLLNEVCNVNLCCKQNDLLFGDEVKCIQVQKKNISKSLPSAIAKTNKRW